VTIVRGNTRVRARVCTRCIRSGAVLNAS
jgi:hypothetical protein